MVNSPGQQNTPSAPASPAAESNPKTGGGGGLTSPDGILMLCIAGILDVISFVPVINVVSDVLGIVIIGGWLLITRPGTALKKAVKRILIAIGIELVPVVSILPSWTWFVYKTLKDS